MVPCVRSDVVVATSGDKERRSSELPPEDLARLSDIVTMQPTSNGELASRWNLDSGKDVHRYLTTTLKEFFYRDETVRIRATKGAEELVASSS
ncbi:DUF5797 family protein [Haloarcula amylovorans]|uniref:DUF5797 family protein n=1 Tax=Haloarcula amylovorans TaxID=2562280 RepID=UPI003741EECB